MENRKFVFKLPSSAASSSISTNSKLGNAFKLSTTNNNYNNGDSASQNKPSATSIPFSIKSFNNQSNQDSSNDTKKSSIFERTATSTSQPNKSTNKASISNFFNKKALTNDESDQTHSPGSKNTKSEAKVSNTKILKQINSQTTLNTFIKTEKNANNSFKKPNLISNSIFNNNLNTKSSMKTESILSKLRDETDDDWETLERKISPKNAFSANNKQESSSSSNFAIKKEIEADNSSSCKSKLNFFNNTPPPKTTSSSTTTKETFSFKTKSQTDEIRPSKLENNQEKKEFL
jgi:hypothetical protein